MLWYFCAANMSIVSNKTWETVVYLVLRDSFVPGVDQGRIVPGTSVIQVDTRHGFGTSE